MLLSNIALSPSISSFKKISKCYIERLLSTSSSSKLRQPLAYVPERGFSENLRKIPKKTSTKECNFWKIAYYVLCSGEFSENFSSILSKTAFYQRTIPSVILTSLHQWH